MPITFLHLSDIHFNKSSGDTFDSDTDLRGQLESDIKKTIKETGPIHGILVTGDIAFSGQPKEYEIAGDWLTKLGGIVNCKQTDTWMTPGNHDVDRAVVEKSAALKDIHTKLRKAKPINLDSDLIEVLRDDTYSKIIFNPIKEYNIFAAKYGCAVTPEQAFWHNDYILNDGSKLRLQGLTSTIISDGSDNNNENKLILGEAQTRLPVEEGVTCLTLCHHPVDWLLDKDNVEHRLNLRAKVQLFGHKHSHAIERINYNAANDTLRIAAGAVHPERDKPGWKPRYNIISLEVQAGNPRLLKIKLFPRVWNQDILAFHHDPLAINNLFIQYDIPLEPWGETPVAPAGSPSTAESPGRQGLEAPARVINTTMLRKVMTDYFNLEELELLCADIEQDLRSNGIDRRVNPDIIGGNGLEARVLRLIQFMEKRDHLDYLVRAVRRARPGRLE